MSLWSVARITYRRPAALAMMAFGVVIGLPVTIVSLFVTGSVWERALLLGACVVVTAFFLLVPTFAALRLHRGLCIGVVASAEIVAVHWSPPGLRPATVDAGRNGMAEGVRRVDYPDGQAEETFESDEVWASRLQVGTKTMLLVHPKLRRVLIDLGPDRL